ncbi:hypothetical protein C0Q70_01589 [Pomacea canaliculata]|uniref:Protein Wnt n=1 Tax=Pomacea canaliculata TaxID=400727 RepID=A0A2T7PZW8_POMCA|nr:hypothetical protein C0Q70_01589 [Pomacea canaliculata]
MEKMASSQAPVSPRELCKLLKLHRRQQRMCRRGKGIPETLIKATRLSVLECQHQFKYERWNCSLGQYRQNILEKGTKETSFLYAISSAGLVHEFARACSQGVLDRCTCDESNPAENKKTWLGRLRGQHSVWTAVHEAVPQEGQQSRQRHSGQSGPAQQSCWHKGMIDLIHSAAKKKAGWDLRRKDIVGTEGGEGWGGAGVVKGMWEWG